MILDGVLDIASLAAVAQRAQRQRQGPFIAISWMLRKPVKIFL